MEKTLTDLAEHTLAYALKQGAQEAAVSVSTARFVDIKQREGKVETLKASESRGLSLALYADERFSSTNTSFLQRDQLELFVDENLTMTRALAPDPHRALPDPSLYGPTQGVELDLCDPGHDALDMDRRLELVREVEQAASGGEVGEEVISVMAGMTSQAGSSLQLHSNGFSGARAGTSFYLGGQVTARDLDGRRPEDYHWTAARHLADLPDAASIGEEALRRALARRGASKVPSGRMTLVVENRAASRMVGSLLDPLSAVALQQRRSCFDESQGEVIASKLLTISDEPLRPRGLGSRTFDGEGLAAHPLPLITQGRLDNYLVDVYYGRKLQRPPTSGSTSNVVLSPGEQDLEALLAGVKRGIYVTSFLGGNANPATGDFSFGVGGFLVENGKLGQPVGEMNITDSHTSIWHRLAAVGNDPYPWAASRIPTLVFADVQFSGM